MKVFACANCGIPYDLMDDSPHTCPATKSKHVFRTTWAKKAKRTMERYYGVD